MKKRAIALISGGIDSILAAKVIMDQGIEVLGISFVIGFASKEDRTFEEHARKTAAEIGLSLKIIDISEEFLELLRAPRHGYGANINPCIDCKILMLKKAKNIMEDEGYGFIVTGEVLGERPMSQRRDALNMIIRDSGLKGYLLRPLSAKLLDETAPEKEGVVDRARLLDIKGRSRKPQMALAEKYGIKHIAQPAGGCLLTDPGFTARVKDLMTHGQLDNDNTQLLKVGRHFRLDPATKVAIGRDEKENDRLLGLKKENDAILRLVEDPGPYAILRGDISAENLQKAAALVAGHSKKKNDPEVAVEWWVTDGGIKTLTVNPTSKETIEKIRI